MGSAAVLTASIVSVAILSSCGEPATQNATSGELKVFAAASLKESFTQIAAAFEQAHPGVHVSLNFAGSSSLVTQIAQGAPADVFASADQTNMTKLADQSLVSSAVPFATNKLQIVVPLDNPAHVDSLANLAKPGTQVVLCAPQVPCGSAAKRVEKAAAVKIKPVSEESNVSDVLGKVLAGDADAGLVYVTDALAARGKVTAIDFSEAGQAINTYPIAAVQGGKNPEASQEFINYVSGASGQRILKTSGFGAP
ncbi:molybdate ABC transporter substrate-binding protein [Pseudarthrobacter sp. J1738]|uniref:molybdate ABC transporter substrate-binding protein n=1 Tax=Pseudarthrobacter sp. J1738 TaxID=3420446 RepID=UPI003D271016